jgi:DNA end-binding protein Ku
MVRPLWKGHISFGMVTIPVSLLPGDRPDEVSFELLDDRDLSPIGYRKVNKTTGVEVPSDHIVRGFRLEDGQVVTVTDEDFKKAAPERTQRIEIRGFLEEGVVPPLYFDRPYYLEPSPAGLKGYVILREAMRRTRKRAVGSVVLRAREHLALLVVDGPWILMNSLRYASELRDPKDLTAPEKSPEDLGIADRELKLAERLIEEMAEPWTPGEYRDRYREELLAAIRRKAERGEARPTPETEAPLPAAKGKVIDMMSLLKESVARAAGQKGRRGKTG